LVGQTEAIPPLEPGDRAPGGVGVDRWCAGSVIGDEVGDESVELLGVFDHRPVAAAVEQHCALSGMVASNHRVFSKGTTRSTHTGIGAPLGSPTARRCRTGGLPARPTTGWAVARGGEPPPGAAPPPGDLGVAAPTGDVPR
jgi:hypothetical protein